MGVRLMWLLNEVDESGLTLAVDVVMVALYVE